MRNQLNDFSDQIEDCKIELRKLELISFVGHGVKE